MGYRGTTDCFTTWQCEPCDHGLLVMVMCSVVLWNVAAKDAVCGAPAQMASAGITYCLMCGSTTDDMFVTAGRFVSFTSCFNILTALADYEGHSKKFCSLIIKNNGSNTK